MKHWHFVGVGGVGMSAMARAALAEGYSVSGCDLAGSALSQAFEREGGIFSLGHDPGHLAGVDRLVVSTAIEPSHPEYASALARGIPVARRIEVLNEFLGLQGIGVSGTHGKTTSTAMLAAILIEAGRDPWVAVGAYTPVLQGNFRYGTGPRLAEVDESDPGFADLQLALSLLTNLEADHVQAPGQAPAPNYYPSFSLLEAAFTRYAQQAKLVIYNADWEILERATRGRDRVSFGLEQGDYRGQILTLSASGSVTTVSRAGEKLGEIRLTVPGTHNAVNALGAATAAHTAGVNFATISRALSKYQSAQRRFEPLGKIGGALAFDDYAHHPTEIAATLQAARSYGLRLRVVFQPHRYQRTNMLYTDIAKALELADEVVLLPIYAAGEAVIAGVNSHQIGELLSRAGQEVNELSAEEMGGYIQATAQPGQIILFMGAGNVGQLGKALTEEVCG